MAIAFDALGTSAGNQNSFTGSLNAAGSHTGTAGAPVLLGYTTRCGGQSRASQTRTVTLGGGAMTLLGFIEFAANEAFSELWSGVANGSPQATSVTVGNGVNAGREIVLNSYSYTGVGSIGAVSTNSGNSSAPSISSIASATGEVVAGLFGASQAALSAFSPTVRGTAYNTGDNFANMIFGEAPGSGSVGLSATRAASGTWGGVFVRLIPPPSSKFLMMF